MTILTRVNRIPNPSFEVDLALWSAFGSASISRVAGFFSWRMRVTMPTAALGVAGAQITVTFDPALVGQQHRLWMQVAAVNGATTYRFAVSGIATGTAVTTTDNLFKQGTLDFTPTGTSHVIQIQSASASTAGDYADVELSICEWKQSAITDYTYFDGDMAGAYWAAAPGQSISTFAYYDTDVALSNTFLPMVITEIDARPIGAGDFILDRDALDGPAALVSSPRWQVVPEVEQVAIRRGRPDDDQPMNAGTCTVTFGDYSGTYDPDNPATPLQTGGIPVLRSGMRGRVSIVLYNLGALFATPLFTGALDDGTIDRSYEPTTTLTFVDDMAKLYGSAIPPFDPPIGSGATTLYRAGWALRQAGIGFFDAVYGSNMQRLMLGTPGGGNAGSELEKAANCEGGSVYAQADGRIHIATHVDDFTTSPAAVFTDNPSASSDITYSGIGTSTSLKQLINRCVIDRDNQADDVGAQDDNSVAINGVKSERVVAPLISDADARTLAQWRATRRSRSGTRVTSVTAQLGGMQAWWPKAVAVDLSSVVAVRRYFQGRGIDGVYSAEGVDHTIIRGSGWQMTVYTVPLDITGLFADQPQPFRLDTSALDGADILAAFT